MSGEDRSERDRGEPEAVCVSKGLEGVSDSLTVTWGLVRLGFEPRQAEAQPGPRAPGQLPQRSWKHIPTLRGTRCSVRYEAPCERGECL